MEAIKSTLVIPALNFLVQQGRYDPTPAVRTNGLHLPL